MSSMPNWEQTIADVSARLKEFGAHSPTPCVAWQCSVMQATKPIALMRRP